MLVAQKLLQLKGRTKQVGLAPGASGPHLPVFARPPVWSLVPDGGLGNGSGLSPMSLKSAFMAGCDNSGVQLMRTKLLRAPRGGVALLAIGPLTDAACLLLNHPETASHISFIGALISQLPDAPMKLEGKAVRDFNMVIWGLIRIINSVIIKS